MLSFQRPGNQGAPKQKAAARAISLVNLALIEPPAPEKPPPVATPPPPPPLPEPPAVEPAETFISLEAPPEGAAAGLEPIAAPASLPDPPPAEPGNAALMQAYVKNNYDYIQRHIRNKLIYPPEARNAGVQGVAELSFVIHTDGHVSNVRVTASSGSETLDASAVEAIYSAAPFRPPPNQARMIIPVAFRLR
jgi:protein TonB